MPEIREVIVMEQFLNSLTPEIRLRVRERNPKTVEEAAKTADHLLQAKKQERSWYSIAGYADIIQIGNTEFRIQR